MGCNLESKGFRIYWPGKRSVSVENNIQNNDGTIPIPRALSEGEKEIGKVIQYPKNHVENPKKAQDQHDNANLPEKETLDDDQVSCDNFTMLHSCLLPF